MDAVTIPSYVLVRRMPRRALLAACWIGLALLVIVVVAGLLLGAPVSLLTLLPIVLLARFAKTEAKGEEWRVVQVGLATSSRGIEIEMPGARLWSGRYVDQRYSCSPEALDGVWMDDSGTFHLRARTLASEAVEAGSVIDRRALDHSEVTFRPLEGGARTVLLDVFGAWMS